MDQLPGAAELRVSYCSPILFLIIGLGLLVGIWFMDGATLERIGSALSYAKPMTVRFAVAVIGVWLVHAGSRRWVTTFDIHARVARQRAYIFFGIPIFHRELSFGDIHFVDIAAKGGIHTFPDPELGDFFGPGSKTRAPAGASDSGGGGLGEAVGISGATMVILRTHAREEMVVLKSLSETKAVELANRLSAITGAKLT